MTKAREMVASANKEIYIRLFPEEGQLLDTHLKEACSRLVMKRVPLFTGGKIAGL